MSYPAMLVAVLASSVAVRAIDSCQGCKNLGAADDHCELPVQFGKHGFAGYWTSGSDAYWQSRQTHSNDEMISVTKFHQGIEAGDSELSCGQQQFCGSNHSLTLSNFTSKPQSMEHDLAKSRLDIMDFLVGPGYFDLRVQSWPLMDWQTAAMMTVVYIVGVYAGTWLMAGQKPFNLGLVSMLHNSFMLFLNLYMAIEIVSQASTNFGWRQNLRLWGNPVEAGSGFSPSGYRLARVLWIDYLTKAYEFVDTLIMILRKSERQITFLHVYHHATVFFPCSWAAMNFNPGGDLWFACTLNCIVHILMYGYYLATSLGCKAPKIVKKSITMAQMVQFALIICQASYDLFWVTWYRPRIVMVLELVQSIIFMYLFHRFMRTAYSGRNKAQLRTESARANCTCEVSDRTSGNKE